MYWGEKAFHKWIVVSGVILLILWVWGFYNLYCRSVQVDVVVVDKYEGLKHGTTTFFVETCIKNDMTKCKLDTFSRRDYDMIEIGENWTIKVRNSEY